MIESSLGGGPPLKWHSFKMILDPQIHAGVRKTVRYDGCLTVPPGGPGGVVNLNPSDPRSKMPPALVRWKRLECMELSVPRFKIDENYVGDPPPVEVTVENLNDNVDQTFLERMIRKFGNIEELEIYYHPVRRKHLGLARIVFELVRSAKNCVKELHGKSVMGKQLNCYVDPFFASAKKMYAELTTEKKQEEPPPIPTNDQSPSNKRNLNNPYYSRDRATTLDYALERSNSYEGDRNEERSYYDYHAPLPQQPSSSQQSQHTPSHLHHSHASYPPPPSGSHGSIETHAAYNSMPMEYWQHPSSVYPNTPQDQGTPSSMETPLSQTEGVVPNEDEDLHDSNQKMDLDTRLKLLMKKGSGSGLIPAFLLNELNSEEEEEEEDKTEKVPTDVDLRTNGIDPFKNPEPIQPELSRPPSPFISVEAYESSSIAWQESKKRASNILAQNIHVNVQNSQKDTSSCINNGTHPSSGKRPTSRESDQMSLSSLSSGDDKIMQQQQASGVYPSMASCLPYPPPGSAPFTFTYSGGWGFDPYTQQWTMHGPVMPPLPGYPPQGIPPPPLPFEAENEIENRKNNLNNKINLTDQYRKLLDESVDVFVRDLKRTIRRDMSKKIGETFAFNLYDEWWQSKENELKNKRIKSKEKRPSSTKPLAESNKLINSSTCEENSEIPKAEDLTSIFDKQRDLSGVANSGGSFGAGGSLGFGFRGSIPKLPSFKIKPTEKKRSDSSDDDSSRKIDDDYLSRRRRREERHRRRREEEKRRRSTKDKSQDSSSQRHRSRSRDKSSSSRKTSSSKVGKSSKNERRREREIRRDKRLKDKSGEEISETIPSGVNKENKSETSISELALSKEEETSFPSLKSKSQTIYTSSSDNEQEIEKESTKNVKDGNNLETTVDKIEKNVSKKKTVVCSSSEVNEASLDDKSVPNIESSSESDYSEEKENKFNSKKLSRKIDKISLKSKKKQDVKVSSESSSFSSDQGQESLPSTKKPSTTALATQKFESSTDSALEDKQSPPHIIDHCYAAVPPKDPDSSSKKRQNSFAEDFANDHGYTKPRSPSPVPTPDPAPPPLKEKKPKPLNQIKTSTSSADTKWSLRDPKEQFEVVYRFLTHGLDLEDLRYLKSCYEMMLNQHSNNKNMMWMNDTHWVDHPVTDLGTAPPNKRRRKDDFSKMHTSGSCRTEGYYKMDPREKMRTKYHLHRDPNSLIINKITNLEGAATRGKIVSAQNLSREARNNQRRQLAVLGDDALNSDLLKFNQLKFRRKQMTFGKSAIHDWGLFAMEDIGADEMVIEYVGSVIRPVLSDVRENRYEKQGIGSSYLFRIDSEYVVDATKCGNLARFINHSCDPNCYAKIITIDGEKKIVIYSRQPIAFGEEITYDYKFPIEDEKIRCLCGSKNCRKYLN
ncbi:uncharacterized protein Set1 [Lepeophtheirus salmonis]|uniref:uncharacterized protein Set1 n=1 Tax=Lepeophtheirus salmonis TaxID=72036 RepID=UPI001AE4CD73|nr:histone-lysine N-methyltransferase SETD1-like [Lepeophtheirus salmonis]XP_040580170.1 histone-lysine N-methyltransferase SETD1-like [Lepeophtheirus salmonis]